MELDEGSKMATVDVKVKWGKQQRTVTVDRSAGINALHTSLEAIFGVPKARQKLMCPKAWRGAAKSDTPLSYLSHGAKVMLMGTAEVLSPPNPPTCSVTGIGGAEGTGNDTAVSALAAAEKEDQDSDEAAVEEQAATEEQDSTANNSIAALWPEAPVETRFLNLGNTSYINSTLQWMRRVPELRRLLLCTSTPSALSAATAAESHDLAHGSHMNLRENVRYSTSGCDFVDDVGASADADSDVGEGKGEGEGDPVELATGVGEGDGVHEISMESHALVSLERSSGVWAALDGMQVELDPEDPKGGAERLLAGIRSALMLCGSNGANGLKGAAVSPRAAVAAVRSAVPRFRLCGPPHGGILQQDAAALTRVIFGALQLACPEQAPIAGPDAMGDEVADTSGGLFRRCLFSGVGVCTGSPTPTAVPTPATAPICAVNTLFGVTCSARYRCVDCASEPEAILDKVEYVLPCACIPAAEHDLAYGLLQEMQTPADDKIVGGSGNKLVRHWSSILGREARWERVGAARVSRLPPYLVVAASRFTFKTRSVRVAGRLVQQRAACKVTRKLAGSEILDALPVCTEELQQELRRRRGTHSEKMATAQTAEGKSIEPIAKGMYELIAVVSHKGRSTDYGHYVCFVRDEAALAAPDRWLVHDDAAAVQAVNYDARVRPLCGLPGVLGHIGFVYIFRATEKAAGYSSLMQLPPSVRATRAQAAHFAGGGAGTGGGGGVRKRIRRRM